MKGWALTRQRLWALLVKRSCCARRDRLAVVTQLAVPILLVLVALWAGKAYVNSPDEPPLRIDRSDRARQMRLHDDVSSMGKPLAAPAKVHSSYALPAYCAESRLSGSKCLYVGSLGWRASVPTLVMQAAPIAHSMLHTHAGRTHYWTSLPPSAPLQRFGRKTTASLRCGTRTTCLHAPRFRHPSGTTAYDSNQTKLFSGIF